MALKQQQTHLASRAAAAGPGGCCRLAAPQHAVDVGAGGGGGAAQGGVCSVALECRVLATTGVKQLELRGRRHAQRAMSSGQWVTSNRRWAGYHHPISTAALRRLLGVYQGCTAKHAVNEGCASSLNVHWVVLGAGCWAYSFGFRLYHLASAYITSTTCF
jgi:hypothetical protein